jgi:tetratricopeptide (TPR) repeat protein
MILKAMVVSAALLVAFAAATVESAQVSTDPPDARIDRLEYWLSTALHHNPGAADDGLVVVGTWSSADLRTLDLDAAALVRLIRNPKLVAENAGVLFSFSLNRQEKPQPMRYLPKQLARLKQIACAAGNFLDAPVCDWARASITQDASLSRVSILAAATRHGDDNFILRRGALLHADIAMLGIAAAEPIAIGPSSDAQPIRVTISDGRQTGLNQSGLHWTLGRRLLDQVSPQGSARPAPERDAMVRLWYIATAAWMQREGNHDNTHLARGGEIFPDAAELLLLAGAQHEAYASRAIQTAVRSAFLPTGVKLDIGSERAELREAEKYLRRAVETSPELAEAHLRLGRVLALMGRDAEAGKELGLALDSTDEDLLVYYGSLFLGSVEDSRGHHETARMLYERASALYPLAQSPRLALSELARRAGHRDEALREIGKVFALPSGSAHDADPWWTYNYVQGRHADALLEELRKPFRAGDEP